MLAKQMSAMRHPGDAGIYFLLLHYAILRSIKKSHIVYNILCFFEPRETIIQLLHKPLNVLPIINHVTDRSFQIGWK